MKIIQLTPSFFPAKGGVETHVLEISRSLVKLGHQVWIVSLDQVTTTIRVVKLELNQAGSWRLRTVDPRFKQNQDARVQVVPILHKLLVWRQLSRLTSWLRTADVVQVHDVAWWLLPIWPLLFKKIFITFHGWEGVFPVPRKNIYQRRLFSYLAHGVIHVGHFIQKFYGDKPDLVVYGGVDRGNSKSKIQNSRSSPLAMDNKNSVLLKQLVFIGRLEPENEVEKYLKLVRRLKKNHPKLKVVWVGDGRYRQQCQKLGQVMGMVDGLTLKQYLKSADLVLASSYLSILQALVLSKPVVAFYSHQLKASYLKDSPMAQYMLISSSPQRVGRWLERGLLPEVKQASDWARQQTWERLAERYLELYYQKLNFNYEKKA